MLDNIKVYKQNSIKINDIYIDPFGITEKLNDAKYIFITHDHYDHWSSEDIEKVMNSKTVFIIPLSMKDEYNYNNEVIFVEPENNYILEDINFKTVRMYNIDKYFHPKDNNWCGYIINLDGVCYYTMGDTDDIPEIDNIKCDVLFVPIGGKFTMTMEEAVNCIKKINYNYVIPVHYGSIIGSATLGNEFKKIIGDQCYLKIK